MNFIFIQRFLNIHILFVLFFTILSCLLNAQSPIQTPTASKPFTDITESAGINHQFVVYEGMFGGGICVFDANKDGFEDFFVTGGMNDDQFYLNQRNGTFKNIYEGSGLELSKHFVTQGVVGADVNRDGWVDLFVTTVTAKDTMPAIPRARNLLFLNKGNGTFRDATYEYGLTNLYSFSTGASFGDFNADGWPDLYVGNYFVGYEGSLKIISDATIAGAHQTAKGYLLENKGGKTFEDVYKKYGLKHRGFSFGAVFTDYDNDGDQDMIVNHDFGYKAVPSYMYENKYPFPYYKDISKLSEMDLKINAMGAAVGDYNEDGWMDYLVTNIRFNRFMVSQGAGKPYLDKSKELGTHLMSISWGANFADFDQDGDLDLYVANGDLNPYCTAMADFYFENEKGHFTDKASVMGLNDYGIGRGSVTFDFDNDGDLDILVVNQKAVSDYPVPSVTHLYRNDMPQKGNWLKIALVGKKAESQGIGSRIMVVADGHHWLREIDGGSSSHLSQNNTIAHFGLGNATKVDSIVVTWTGGKQQVLVNQPINTLLTIVENEEFYIHPTYMYVFFTGLSLLLGLIWWLKKRRFKENL
jgi:enediyne biosynthesis protein E4